MGKGAPNTLARKVVFVPVGGERMEGEGLRSRKLRARVTHHDYRSPSHLSSDARFRQPVGVLGRHNPYILIARKGLI